MIKAIIFDLDNCLAAADEVGRQLLAPAFAAIRQANRGTVTEAALEDAFEECWRSAFDDVATKHGFSEEMRAAGWRALVQTEVKGTMRGYGDLGVLAQLPVQRFLVTSGFLRLQQSKINALGIAPLFAGIHIDAIDHPDRPGKQELFRRILETQALEKSEVLIVGDNPRSEIEAGNRLGLTTVQILRPGVSRTGAARHHIQTLEELMPLCHASE